MVAKQKVEKDASDKSSRLSNLGRTNKLVILQITAVPQFASMEVVS